MNSLTQEDTPTRAELRATKWEELNPNNVYDLIKTAWYLVWVKENEIKSRLHDKLERIVSDWRSEQNRDTVARIIATFRVLGIDSVSRLDFNDNCVERLLRQGWLPRDIKITYVDVNPVFYKVLVKFEAPNELTVGVDIKLREFEDLTKEEFDKVKWAYREVRAEVEEVYKNVRIRELEEIIKRLKEEKEEYIRRIAELEDRLRECSAKN